MSLCGEAEEFPPAFCVTVTAPIPPYLFSVALPLYSPPFVPHTFPCHHPIVCATLKKKRSDKRSEFKKCFPNYFLYYCTVVQCEAHALYMYSTVLEDKTVVGEPCLRGKTQMQLIYFSEIRNFFTFLEYVKK